MVQEVQTGVGISNETTLETIQAVGTSSVKIVEGRQTTGHYSVGCILATGDIIFSSDDPSEILCESLYVSSEYGNKDFIIRDYGVRIPVAGTYEIKISFRGGAMNLSATVILKLNGKDVYTKTVADTSTTVADTIHLELGKFDIIQLYTKHIYYGGGSAGGAGFQEYPKITITQL